MLLIQSMNFNSRSKITKIKYKNYKLYESHKIKKEKKAAVMVEAHLCLAFSKKHDLYTLRQSFLNFCCQTLLQY